jgi:hypothetical protein
MMEDPQRDLAFFSAGCPVGVFGSATYLATTPVQNSYSLLTACRLLKYFPAESVTSATNQRLLVDWLGRTLPRFILVVRNAAVSTD